MRDLRDFYDPNLHATIDGTRFTVKCPTAAEGLRLRAIMGDPKRASEVNDLEVINGLFRGDDLPDDAATLPTGGLWDELWAADVTWPEAIHLGLTAAMYYGLSEQTAVDYWESAATDTEDAEGKAPTPTKKTPGKTTKKKTTS